MRFLPILAVALIGAVPSAHGQDFGPSGAPAAWFMREVALLSANGGRWVADNADYENDEEPYDEYGMEWRSSFNGTSLHGRMFGLIDGEEAVDFWEYRIYWHPGERKAYIQQFGWGGAVGIGEMKPDDSGMRSRITQFTSIGTENEFGYIRSFPDSTTQITESFDIEDDEWASRRRYEWRLSPARD